MAAGYFAAIHNTYLKVQRRKREAREAAERQERIRAALAVIGTRPDEGYGERRAASPSDAGTGAARAG